MLLKPNILPLSYTYYYVIILLSRGIEIGFRFMQALIHAVELMLRALTDEQLDRMFDIMQWFCDFFQKRSFFKYFNLYGGWVRFKPEFYSNTF